MPLESPANLLEREGALTTIRERLAHAAGRKGHTLLVCGEAGVGKTSLLRRAAEEYAGRLWWGACDALETPHPLAPLRDIARESGAPFRKLLEPGIDRSDLFEALLAELGSQPTLMVIEDAHWADESTLDVVKFLARRIARLPAVLAVTYRDDEVYTAINHDLKIRNDASSPMVRRLPNGDPIIDHALMPGWNEYERLVRSLTIRIILRHPIAVLETLPIKIKDQIDWFDNPVRHSMAWVNLRILVLIVAAGALICAVAGGFTVNRATFRSAALFTAVLLLFALVTPLLEPSALSIGTLFSYIGVIAVAVSGAAVFLIRAAMGLKSKPQDVSLGVKSVP